MNIKLKIVNKKRLMFFTSLFLFLVVTLSVVLFSQTAVSGETARDHIIVYASSGDTLWSIAERYNNNKDIRESVYNIIKYNDFDESCLDIGQEIKIPLD